MPRKLIRNGTFSRTIAVLLFGAFLFAQGVVLVHDLDPATHGSDHVCEVCFPASDIGGAVVASVDILPVIPVGRSVEPRVSASFVSAPTWRATARGPPIAS